MDRDNVVFLSQCERQKLPSDGLPGRRGFASRSSANVRVFRFSLQTGGALRILCGMKRGASMTVGFSGSGFNAARRACDVKDLKVSESANTPSSGLSATFSPDLGGEGTGVVVTLEKDTFMNVAGMARISIGRVLFRLLTLSLAVLLINRTLKASEVTVVVGGMMPAEGGRWDPKTSPLTSPFGVDFDSEGRMWIVELEGGRVQKVDATGKLTHVGGDGSKSYNGDGGPLASATFNGMHNCAVTPNGDLYIADSWNHCVRKVDARSAIISTIAGTGEKGFSGDGGSATAATFDFVMCITLNPSCTLLHIADLNNHRIRAVDLKSGIVTTIAGNGQSGVPQDGAIAVDSPLVDPRAVAEDSRGNVYVLERGGHALRVVRPDGTIHTVAGTGKKGYVDGPALTAQFGSPKHLCVDDADNVCIADDENGVIRKFDPKKGEVSTLLGQGHGDPRIRLRMPHGVCWERGVLFVVDMGNNRVLRVSELRSP